MRKLVTLVRNTLRPGYFPVMARKVFCRLEKNEGPPARDWASRHAIPFDEYALSISPALREEALLWSEGFKARASRIVEEVGLDLGGGGCIELLYMLTRLLRPAAVLETGVAAGWSSAAILSALQVNGYGVLYSSDFPYFRYDNPEKLVGIVVPEHLRDRWHLHLRGDRRNIPAILREADSFALVHYDSDKSRAGREMVLNMVRGHLASGAYVVMDDIQHDLFFRDLVSAYGAPWAVIPKRGEFLLGIIGPL
jgi:predicted O-methyltransferase YrrM